MGLFKKKEEDARLPDLPESASVSAPPKLNLLDEDDEFSDEKHVLPAFPDSPTHNRFSQAAIKDAVGSSRNQSEESMSPSKGMKVVEMEEWSPQKMRMSSNDSFGENSDYRSYQQRMVPLPPSQPMRQSREIQSKTSDVFVRLDKFQSAKKALSEIHQDLSEIDEMIRKIRETKLREDQELSSWERDLMQVKSRIQEVTENIFEKVD